MAGDPSDLSPGYIANNAPRLISYSIYVAFNAGLFAYAMYLYAESPLLVQIARGCGALVNFNAGFCLLPMMRLCISWLRRFRFSRYLALEDSIDFHRIAGHTMFAAAIVHTFVYVILYAQRGSIIGGLTGSTASITGCVLVAMFVTLWIFALEKSRQRWPYEAFLTAHGLAIPLAAILLVHSPNYWKWFAVGAAGYLADRAIRVLRMRRPTKLILARELPSLVTELVIERPPGWEFRPGDFVWILIPSVSRLEWHPFTISSPPERLNTFTMHVRTVGDWTEHLRKRHDKLAGETVYFDGPHGAPANDIFAKRVAVLVGAGIGVTPFASILQSLLARMDGGQSISRVYFYWINRDHTAFEWFTHMLSDVKRADNAGMFDIRLFVTDPPPHELPVFTQHGRPDWASELAEIRDRHGTDDVGLFYCGPRGLSKSLRAHCRSIGWTFKEEHF